MEYEPPYNPLDKGNLGESVADALLAKPVIPLYPLQSFGGAGIYVIYYVGKFERYEKLSVLNRDGKFVSPIYVGKAVPEGARKGGTLGVYKGNALAKRLKKHADSISQAGNLDVKDFFCRYLVLEDIWIPLGESLLIEKFKPLWNQVIEGFGINAPGKNREKQKRSMWDRVHPGRSYAGSMDEVDISTDKVMENTEKHLMEYLEAFQKSP